MKRLMFLSLLIATTGSAEDLPFERVFTSSKERQVLNQIREDGLLGNTTVVRSEVELAPDPTAESIQFSGYVLRSDGSQVLFIDGQSDFTRLGEAGTRRTDLNPEDDSITFQAREQAARLKPGQVWLLEENRVVESYDATPPAAVVPPEKQ